MKYKLLEKPSMDFVYLIFLAGDFISKHSFAISKIEFCQNITIWINRRKYIFYFSKKMLEMLECSLHTK